MTNESDKPQGQDPATGRFVAGNKLGQGRPSLYDPSYCERLIADMAEGHSIGGFAGDIGVSRRVITQWQKAHPEFDDAVQIGKAKQLRLWEKKAIAAASTSGASQAIIIFSLKNAGAEDWVDVQRQEHTGRDGDVGTLRVIIENDPDAGRKD